MKDGMPRTKRLIVVPPSSMAMLPAGSLSMALRSVGPRRVPMTHFLRAGVSQVGGPISGPGRPPTRQVAKRAARAEARQLTLALPRTVEIVDTAAVDGTMLIDPHGGSRRDLVKALPPGAEVFEEQWYRLERPGAPWLLRTGRTQTDPPAGAGAQVLTVNCDESL